MFREFVGCHKGNAGGYWRGRTEELIQLDAPVSGLFATMTVEEVVETAVTTIFVGVNAPAALPGLRSIIQSWKPDLITLTGRVDVSFQKAFMKDPPLSGRTSEHGFTHISDRGWSPRRRSITRDETVRA